MQIVPPRIIQGGMGAGISHWRLARAVSMQGQLGVVSGTALDNILARRLQAGDPGGHMRRALAHFPLRTIAREILEKFYVPGDERQSETFLPASMHTLAGARLPQALCIAANFVEVFLAREGHAHPVGINYLEKIQMPHLPSLYGAMLGGVSVVIVGAGLPLQFPAMLDLLAEHRPARYAIDVAGLKFGHEATRMTFDPRAFWDDGMEPLAPMARPDLLPIVSSHALAGMLARRAGEGIAGFVVEKACAGGHNAPPRGRMVLTPEGEPVYGARDEVDLDVMRKLGFPFWLAGGYGSPEGLRVALAESAAGVQIGTAFALCAESGFAPDVRRALIRRALNGRAVVFTDAVASPTGFPFKVARLEGTLSEPELYQQRKRICDIGILRQLLYTDDGKIVYRCPAEPEAAYLAKGGKIEDTVGRKCLCNGLVANIGLPQTSAGIRERCLITLGEDFVNIKRFCNEDHPEYTAADVCRILLNAEPASPVA